MDYSLYRAEDFAADESFISYHLGSHPADVAFWKEWISLHPEKLDEVMLAERLLDRLLMRIPDDELEAEQQRMLHYVQRGERDRSSKQAGIPVAFAPRRRQIPVLVWVLLPLIALLTVYIVYNNRQPAPIKWLSYHNAPGKRTTITLDDGSQVILNAGANLQYHRWEKGDSMRVKLDGEAYFEITPNKQRVFIVKAGEVDIAVLGTGFNVLNTPEEKTQTIALVHGKVHIHTPHGDAMLQPQQEAFYTPQTGYLEVKTFDTETVAGWKDGIIKWQKATLQEVAATLQKRHHVILINKTGITPAPYTGRFENARIEDIIKSYCYTQRLTYTIHGHEVILQTQR